MPPNVLWVCADDYACGVSGAYGSPVARTPHVDRLAADGVRFDAAFCNCPLSTPARQAFWAGRYPRSVGVTLSPTPLPADEVTLPAMLRAAGYLTAAYGKTHYYAARKHEFHLAADHEEFYAWRDSRDPTPLPPGDYLGPWRPFWQPGRVWLNADAKPFAAVDADMADSWYTRHACEFLAAGPPRPFFLYLSLFANHSPFRFPAEYAGRFRADQFTAPAVTPEDAAELPPVFAELTDADRRGILAAYHTATEFMDANVGRVLAALDAAGLRDETLVLFTSDHGYMLGEHGRFEKHCLYEPAVRAALVARLPGVAEAGRSSAALVELLDLVPTVLDLCGLPTPENVQGRSLVPLLRGETERHRVRVYVEYADNAEACVRTDRWKLIYGAGNRRRRDGYADDRPSPGKRVRLFDLASDPGELTDLAGRPEHAARVAELSADLLAHLRRTARRPLARPAPDADAEFAALLTPTELL